MAAEIERKFLLKSDEWRAGVRRSRSIRQGYLVNTDTMSVRVRIYDASDAKLTLKSEREGIRRNEFEYPIPRHDADQLLLLSQGSIIEKTRHELFAGQFMWEIDVFTGDNDGLILAEIELDFADQDFARPAWLGDEVTADPRYYNANLSSAPFRQWREDDEGI